MLHTLTIYFKLLTISLWFIILMEWNCCVNNPAVRGYRNLCKRFGGREVGQLHQTIKLMDGKIYDTIIFEVIREDYIKSKERKK